MNVIKKVKKRSDEIIPAFFTIIMLIALVLLMVSAVYFVTIKDLSHQAPFKNEIIARLDNPEMVRFFKGTNQIRRSKVKECKEISSQECQQIIDGIVQKVKEDYNKKISK